MSKVFMTVSEVRDRFNNIPARLDDAPVAFNTGEGPILGVLSIETLHGSDYPASWDINEFLDVVMLDGSYDLVSYKTPEIQDQPPEKPRDTSHPWIT